MAFDLYDQKVRCKIVHFVCYPDIMYKSGILDVAFRTLMQPLHNGLADAYKAFCADDKLHFKIVYNTQVIPKPEVLLVLDSSFNPPHWGHHALIEKGLRLYDGRSTQVLLLLAVNNADKAAAPASFDKRMEMMCLMADLLHKNGSAVSVGITDYAKYVDKDIILRKHYKDARTISFLVGFDTIVRIFAPKYYYPRLPSEALESFMASTELCCLTREGNHNLEEQMKYSSDISNGVYEPNIPKSWGAKIHMMENDKIFESISSSAIRKAIAEGQTSEKLSKLLPLPIVDYILSSKDQMF
ncbi:hypothetical protein HG536_0B00440 [Torulaspora globosa]|uniref:Cytidyltransferase-like domain-containing protein n=1 Tax=Torulaspora globosa TaxID=48254 RepID=A0A7G3ZCE7_9SACH|nr:uncharacterized protein HG536_0B00440 [Torulaspora globosa]QLL31183.1 hypothetical protein HG536_0B00440 [Torulaspora globosa]